MSFDDARTLNCYTLRRSKDICIAINERMPYGLFTWREEDPGTRKIREGETTFRLFYAPVIGFPEGGDPGLIWGLC